MSEPEKEADALVELRGHTLIVTLNRPQARNALSTEMLSIMVEAWDRVDKPAAVAAHRAIQDVDVTGLSDAQLADHVDRCAAHTTESAYLHHKYTMAACLPVGRLVAG